MLGCWLGRLSLWHTGLAVEYFNDAAWDKCNWLEEHMKIEWCPETDCYIETHEPGTLYISDSDSDYELNDCLIDKTTSHVDDLSNQSSSEDDCYSDNENEDLSWMMSSDVESTWKVTDEGVHRSTRVRYQQRPL